MSTVPPTFTPPAGSAVATTIVATTAAAAAAASAAAAVVTTSMAVGLTHRASTVFSTLRSPPFASSAGPADELAYSLAATTVEASGTPGTVCTQLQAQFSPRTVRTEEEYVVLPAFEH